MKKTLLMLTLLSILLIVFSPIVIAETEIPFLSELFQPVEVKLNMLDGENRATSYSGPGKNYIESGGYKPYKQRKVIIYFRENGWYLTDITYQTAEERYVYFRKSDLNNIPGNFPEVETLDSWEGVTLGSAMPAWGPGSQFNRVEHYTVPDGTRIKAFFQENGFVYAEYMIDGKLTRMWLPADQVSLYGATVTATDETRKSYTVSQFGKRGIAPSSTQTGHLNFDNDSLVCNDCGGKVNVTTTIAYAPYDDQSHQYGPIITYECQSCHNMQFEGGDSVYLEAHSFSDGICTKCGYNQKDGKACSNCGSGMILMEYYHDIPHDTCSHLSNHYQYYECLHCGYRTEAIIVDSQLNPHHFNDGEDDCIYCGFHDYGD